MIYLNGLTANGTYKIFGFDETGYPVSLNPLIQNITEVTHIAWQNAFKEAGITMILASVLTTSTGKWDAIRRFTSSDGISFTDQGNVFTANGSETGGIGPAAILWDGSQFVMYYAIRGTNNVGSATSSDGIAWTRQGTIYTGSGSDEAGSVSVSWAQVIDGEYVVGIHCYNSALTHANSKIIRSTNPTSGFGNKALIFSYDGFSSTALASAGGSWATVPSGVTIPLHIPLYIAGTNQEVNVAKKQIGTTVWFERPFTYSHASGTPIYSVFRRKADISHVEKQSDGTYTGWATGYNCADGIAAEFVTGVRCDTLDGTWQYDETGLPFRIFYSSNVISMENPSPVVNL